MNITIHIPHWWPLVPVFFGGVAVGWVAGCVTVGASIYRAIGRGLGW